MFLEDRSLRLGWISYWNMWPFYSELKKQNSLKLSFYKDCPVKVNALLRRGLVDIAPSSSVNLLASSELEVALPLGVVTNGSVLSVYLGLKKEDLRLRAYLEKRRKELRFFFQEAALCCHYDPLKMVKLVKKFLQKNKTLSFYPPPSLHFSSQSASGRALAKIFYLLWFGEDAYRKVLHWGMKGDKSASFELVIGDDALLERGCYKHIFFDNPNVRGCSFGNVTFLIFHNTFFCIIV